MAKRIGQATGTVMQSPARAKRQAAKRRREEASWAAKNGPVEVRRVGDPPVSDTPSEVPHDDAASA